MKDDSRLREAVSSVRLVALSDLQLRAVAGEAPCAGTPIVDLPVQVVIADAAHGPDQLCRVIRSSGAVAVRIIALGMRFGINL